MNGRSFWMAAFVMVGSYGSALAQTAPPAPPSAEAFAEAPAVSDAILSPSGRYLAFVGHRGESANLFVRDLETGQTTPIIGSQARESFGGIFIDWVSWKSDDRLIIGLSNVRIGRTGNRVDGDVYSINYGRSILSIARDGVAHISLQAPATTPGNPGSIIALLPNDPEHVLMTYRGDYDGLDLARVNVLTGESEKVADGDTRVRSYLTDRDGKVVGRTVLRGAFLKTLVMQAAGDDGSWTEIFRLRQDDIRALPDYAFFGPTDKPNEAYVTVSSDAPGGDPTAGVHIYDFATRTLGPTLWRNERYDAAAIMVDSETSAFLGGCYTDDVFHCDFIDPVRNAQMDDLRRALGADYNVSIASRARDGSRWLVHASAPNDPGQYLLYDTRTRQLERVTGLYRLPTAALAPMRRIDYAAADGMPLFGYLTRPAGAAPTARPPLVVMPHGGPETRDSLAYDVWVQFLASRGYQVFQPNFRGSAGMGRAFAEAGHREWGGLMQQDISDGVEALVQAGTVDPTRICIVGASYGGYAALQAGATQPDLYRCVISISGVSDLNAMLRWERSESGPDSDTYEYWLKSIGDPRTDRERIEAASPIQHVADWRPPVLLIHGETDGTVPVEQSRNMDRALRRARKQVRYVELPNQDHNGWITPVEIQVMNEMGTFLANWLPVEQPGGPPSAVAP